MGLGFLFALPCRPSSVRRDVRVCARAPVDDSNVPEGHRGLHDSLYGAGTEAEHGSSRSDTQVGGGFESDGEDLFDVDIAMKVLGNRKVAGVYAVLNEGQEVEYIGISRNVPLKLAAHRASLGTELVRYVRIVTFSFPRREEMETVRNEWIEELGEVPPGNAVGARQWTATVRDAAQSVMDGDSLDAYEDKKAKLKKAMGEIEPDNLPKTEAARIANLRNSVENDDWSAVIEEQTKETTTGEISPVIESPFADGKTTEELRKSDLVMDKETVNAVLDEVRPYLVADGGNVKVLSVDGGNVQVLLEGACGSCPSSTTTMQMGIEKVLRDNFKDFESVTAVSDAAEALGDKLSIELCDLILEQVRPAIVGLGGVVNVVKAEGNGIVLKYTGPEKLAYGIELMLKDKFPEVTDISFES